MRRYRISECFTQEFEFSCERQIHVPESFNGSVLHQREFWKIIYIIKGRGEKLINGNRYPLHPGGLFLIHPDDQTSYIIKPPHIEICNILFLPELIASELHNLNDNFGFFSILRPNFRRDDSSRTQLYILKSDQAIKRIIKNLETEFVQKKANYRSLIKYNLLELLILLGRKASRLKKNVSAQDLSDYIDHVVEQHFSEEFDLDYLSEQAGVTKSHLCRVYRKTTGKTIMDKIRLLRLQKARNMLLDTPQTVTEICYACGFNDLSYFYRCFTAFSGYNPGEFRKHFGLD